MGRKIIHGEGKTNQTTKEYKAWLRIKYRCDNPNSQNYPRYGGRGIDVCKRWRDSFLVFLNDIGRAPSPKHSLDRWPNNNGNYELGNVRWATPKEQRTNQRPDSEAHRMAVLKSPAHREAQRQRALERLRALEDVSRER
jgi:hypothetical protein